MVLGQDFPGGWSQSVDQGSSHMKAGLGLGGVSNLGLHMAMAEATVSGNVGFSTGLPECPQIK